MRDRLRNIMVVYYYKLRVWEGSKGIWGRFEEDSKKSREESLGTLSSFTSFALDITDV